jgi:hypothetical protein
MLSVGKHVEGARRLAPRACTDYSPAIIDVREHPAAFGRAHLLRKQTTLRDPGLPGRAVMRTRCKLLFLIASPTGFEPVLPP